MAAGIGFVVAITFITTAAPLFAPQDPDRLNPVNACSHPRANSGSGPTKSGVRCTHGRSTGAASLSWSASRSRRSRWRSATVFGLTAGYFRKADAIIMRFMDGLMAFPMILLRLRWWPFWGQVWRMSLPPLWWSPSQGDPRRSGQRAFPSGAAIRRGGTGYRRAHEPNPGIPHFPEHDPAVDHSGDVYLCARHPDRGDASFLGAGISPDIPSWGNMMAEGNYSCRSPSG